MNSCETCKWWAVWSKFPFSYGRCNDPYSGFLDCAGNQQDDVHTKPLFECSHWEAKEQLKQKSVSEIIHHIINSTIENERADIEKHAHMSIADRELRQAVMVLAKELDTLKEKL